MKRTILTLGTIAAIAAPVASVVACGSSSHNDETYKGKLGDKKIKILTLGDSVAHGDYTFQMSGSGTGFTPLLDGPARAASYQDYLFDEFQRDGLMNENDKPNYRTSASGLRSGELAKWLAPGGTYISGQTADLDEAITTEEMTAAHGHIEYHRHPYTYHSETEKKSTKEYESGKTTWWDDGLKDDKGVQIDAKHQGVSSNQQDGTSMHDYIAGSDKVTKSNVILITIGGNDILKDIKVLGTPFPNLGGALSKLSDPKAGGAFISGFITNFIRGFKTEMTKKHILTPKIDEVIAAINDPSFLPKALKTFSDLKGQITAGLGKLDIGKLFTEVLSTFGNVTTKIAAVPEAEKIAFNNWFMKEGHKSLITVSDTVNDSLAKFKTNIKTISDEIHSLNPDANIIFTGYPSPLMHFPKVMRNLAMPTYGRIAEETKEFADETEGVYYAPSSLQNWETDDPTDIYDNIMIDPHPTLEGQGAMAQDILKVIDNIYGINSKLTKEELDAETSAIVDAHKQTAPEMTVAERNKEIADGTYPYPYQSHTDKDGDSTEYNGDLDYAYGVKPIAMEELSHAKVYFGSRIVTFLLDAITDSIQLNSNVIDHDKQSVPHTGSLTLSDFTTDWAASYLATHSDEKFIEPFDKDILGNVQKEFKNSIEKFLSTFLGKIKSNAAASPKLKGIQSALEQLSNL